MKVATYHVNSVNRLLKAGLAPQLLQAKVDAAFLGCERAGDHAPAWITLADA